MHANTALPSAWALGALMVLTGCASRGPSTAHPLDVPVTPAVVESTQPPALRVPAPPSVRLLSPERDAESNRHTVPFGREETVHPGLVSPVQRVERSPAPCALSPELSARRQPTRAAASEYDGPALFAAARDRAQAQGRLDASPCAGGT